MHGHIKLFPLFTVVFKHLKKEGERILPFKTLVLKHSLQREKAGLTTMEWKEEPLYLHFCDMKQQSATEHRSTIFEGYGLFISLWLQQAVCKLLEEHICGSLTQA